MQAQALRLGEREEVQVGGVSSDISGGLLSACAWDVRAAGR